MNIQLYKTHLVQNFVRSLRHIHTEAHRNSYVFKQSIFKELFDNHILSSFISHKICIYLLSLTLLYKDDMHNKNCEYCRHYHSVNRN